MTNDLARKKCLPCEGGIAPLAPAEIAPLLAGLQGWDYFDKLSGGYRAAPIISKTFTFNNYYETLAFVNAVAWLSHREDHHPDMTVGYKTCRIEYTTHAIGGLSLNDFICAAKVDALFDI